MGQEVALHELNGALHHPLGLWIGFMTDPDIQAHLVFKLLKLMSEDDVAFVLTDDNDAVLIHSDLLRDPPKELESASHGSD
ncbi:hypothetical protein SDC9_111616 [bioreactor metagenome]|uniref:Uncharacterized protein n=1 Tax=bioreactor metagenome TaxID=1076179 RepID=A0A645BH84_9ZZZZ